MSKFLPYAVKPLPNFSCLLSTESTSQPFTFFISQRFTRSSAQQKDEWEPLEPGKFSVALPMKRIFSH
jgi:hypothetical protein